MVREINLKNLLPEFIGEYREIGEILRAEQPELQTMANGVEQARDCSFILYCDEQGVRRFERMMGVYPSERDTLSERQGRILIRWNESPPYTLSALNEKLAAICGDDNFSVSVIYDAYRLELSVTLARAGQVEELERLLQRIIPANMIVSIRNTMIAEPAAGMVIGGAISTSTFFIIGE